MRSAPPVHVLCLGRVWRWGQAGVVALAGAAVAAWAVQHLGALMFSWPAWQLSLAVAVVAFAAVGAWAARLLRVPAAELRWDGQQWWLGQQPCTVELMLQVGEGVLVRARVQVQPVAGSQQVATWLAVTASDAGPAWHGLLVALRAQPRADSLASQGWAL